MNSIIKKALKNAVLAEIYIIAIVLVINFGVTNFDGKDSIIIPIVMLSLFVLSAAVMGYLFLAQPAMLFLEGQKKEAVNLFLSTVSIFAIIAVIILLLLFSGVLF